VEVKDKILGRLKCSSYYIKLNFYTQKNSNDGIIKGSN
jgi:hypothetical protein